MRDELERVFILFHRIHRLVQADVDVGKLYIVRAFVCVRVRVCVCARTV